MFLQMLVFFMSLTCLWSTICTSGTYTDLFLLFIVLADNGGIYLDLDVLVVKSFDPLRKFELTLGAEPNRRWLHNGIIMSEPGSMFMCVWLGVWSHYVPSSWYPHKFSMDAPRTLSTILPEHIHIEETSFHSPGDKLKHLLYLEHYDWSRSYAIHVFHSHSPAPVPTKPEDIDHLDTALGEVMRYIYYGSKKLRP